MNNGIEKMINPDTLILKNVRKSELNNLMKEKEVADRIAFMPVRPDWNEPRKLWGYYNPLTGLFYPTDALRVLLNAWRELVKGGKDRKHFIILDEMNLARVEYYMSDLLSLMENMSTASDSEVTLGEVAMVHPLARCILSRLPDDDGGWEKYVKKEDGQIKWKIEGEKICLETCDNCPYIALKNNIKKQGKKNQEENLEKFIAAFEPIPPRIAYPENLVIIGTVNVDETTFSFAPKVLDRAFVLEFNDVYVDKYCEEYGIGNDEFKNFVNTLNEILKPANLHFGYRVINEMWAYLSKKKEQEKPSGDSFDFLLKSKVLPKIHGTEEQVGRVLEGLLAYCVTGVHTRAEKLESAERWWDKTLNDIKNILQKEDRGGDAKSNEPNKEPGKNPEKGEENEQVRFEQSARKILEMYRRLKATGYCSYF